MLSVLYQLLSIRSNPDNFVNKLYADLVTKLNLKHEIFVQEFVSKFNQMYSDFLRQTEETRISCSETIKLAIDECFAANFDPTMRYITAPGMKKILDEIKSAADQVLIDELNSLNTKFELDIEFLRGKFTFRPNHLIGMQIQKIPNLDNLRHFRILKKHFGEIYKLSKVLNKNQIISASKDNSIRMWDLDKMACLWTLCVNRPEFVISNEIVICAENDGSIRILDLNSGETLKEMTNIFLEVSSILEVSEKKILTGLMNGEILMWDIKNFKICDTIPGHLLKVSDLKMLNASSFISSSWDKTIKLWTLGFDKAIRCFKGHKDSVTCLEVFNENEFLSGSKDGTVKIWHINLTCCVETLIGHKSGINKMKVFENYQLLSCSNDGTIKHWDTVKASCLKTFKISDQFRIRDFIVLNNGAMITAENKEIKIWA